MTKKYALGYILPMGAPNGLILWLLRLICASCIPKHPIARLPRPKASKNRKTIAPSKVGQKRRFYNQIALKMRDNNLARAGRGGVFDYFDLVYRDDDYEACVSAMMEG